MTILGIGGCMGLLMVGYGLRDSISSISQYQYGELQLYDCSVYISDDMDDEEMKELEDYLEGNRNVTNYMNAAMLAVTTQNEKVRKIVMENLRAIAEDNRRDFRF